MAKPEIVTTDPMLVAFIVMHGPYDQIPEGYGTLYAWVGSHGLRPEGMPAAVYLTPPGEGPVSESVWELWAPVSPDAAERSADERGIGVKHVAATTAVSLMHVGPYETIAAAYEELWRWVTENGYTPDGPPMERYFSDPAKVLPEEYQTEILVPMRAQ